MSQSTRAEGPALNSLKNCALLLCLFAPSVWMITTLPPLWRDLDAYFQLATHPLVATFGGHGPAYCYLAKLPLFLGEQWERWRGFTGAVAGNASPPLTDAGLWLLIVAQHLGLGGALFYFIRSISNSFWIQLTLALITASNALFYTFAHCVGSETLSLILIVVLAAKALRMIRSRHQPHWVDWYLFAITLCLCLLTRHANLWLLLLLPATSVISWAHNRAASLPASGERERCWRRRVGSRQLRLAVIAIVIGAACMTVANSLPPFLARKTKLHPHSRIGHTLMWRLQFLKTLAPPERAAVLQKVAARTQSPQTRQLLALLGQMLEEGTDVVGTRPFMHRAAALLFPGETPIPWERLDIAVNQMAYAFLLPPTPEHWQAVRTDLAAALKMSVTGIADQLFDTTNYFFDHKEEMPAIAQLVTFRNTSAEAISRIPIDRTYFHLWQGLNYKKAILIWLGALLLFVVLARGRKMSRGAIAPFATVLVGTGLLMTASACLLTAFLPRYALPMWLLLLLSFYALCGAAADLIILSPSHRPVGGAGTQH